MAVLKTQSREDDVQAFLDAVPDPVPRRDARAVCELMGAVTGEEPRMWGDSMVGFGSYHYTYASGREGDWFVDQVDTTVLRDLVRASVRATAETYG